MNKKIKKETLYNFFLYLLMLGFLIYAATRFYKFYDMKVDVMKSQGVIKPRS